jgi:hypothetical protein
MPKKQKDLTDQEIISAIETTPTMAAAARFLGLDKRTFTRRALKMGVYNPHPHKSKYVSKEEIINAINECDSKHAAADFLGLYAGTFIRKLKQYDIDFDLIHTKVPDNEFIKIVTTSRSMASAARELNIPFTSFVRRAKRWGVYTPNRNEIGVNKGQSKPKIPLDEILLGYYPKYSKRSLKRRLFETGTFEPICNKCGVGEEWNGALLSLQLDHINGISTDHRLNNLQILCPNCHSQTENFCSKNKRTQRKARELTNDAIQSAFEVAGNLTGTCKLNSKVNKNRIKSVILPNSNY